MGRREKLVRDLAAELGVNVYLEKEGGSVYPSGRYPNGKCYHSESRGYEAPWILVSGWDGRNTLCTLAALHELGHHACGTPGSAEVKKRGILEAEAEAWNWALDHWPERTLCRNFFRALKTYWLGSYIEYDDPDLVTAGTSYQELTLRTKGLPTKERIT